MEKKNLKATSIYWALAIQAFVAILFLIFSSIKNNTGQFLFLLFNLFLAWIPLVIALTIRQYLKKNPWLSFKGVALAFVWVCFLPNSFYIISDLIHLNNFNSFDILFDIITFFLIAVNGIIAGVISVYLIHEELNKRLKSRQSLMIVMGLFLMCGFGIYLGRYLRLNSWDVITNPLVFIFDMTNPLFDPQTQLKAFTACIGILGLLGTSYLVLWQSIEHHRGSMKI
ncbi:MAG: DUF1361 domain-containing protein [bacterium]